MHLRIACIPKSRLCQVWVVDTAVNNTSRSRQEDSRFLFPSPLCSTPATHTAFTSLLDNPHNSRFSRSSRCTPTETGVTQASINIHPTGRSRTRQRHGNLLLRARCRGPLSIRLPSPLPPLPLLPLPLWRPSLHCPPLFPSLPPLPCHPPLPLSNAVSACPNVTTWSVDYPARLSMLPSWVRVALVGRRTA